MSISMIRYPEALHCGGSSWAVNLRRFLSATDLMSHLNAEERQSEVVQDLLLKLGSSRVIVI